MAHHQSVHGIRINYITTVTGVCKSHGLVSLTEVISLGGQRTDSVSELAEFSDEDVVELRA